MQKIQTSFWKYLFRCIENSPYAIGQSLDLFVCFGFRYLVKLFTQSHCFSTIHSYFNNLQFDLTASLVHTQNSKAMDINI